MKQVFCIGELLIDFICCDHASLRDGIHFEKKAGGAPANVAAAIAKLGGNASFMGQVGKDPFGDFLEKTLQENNVDTSMLVKDKQTTFAFVSIDKHGERDFTFMRGADGEYQFQQIDLSKMQRGDMIHFGSATALLPGELKETYFKLLQYTKEQNHFISFDPNYRDALVTDPEQFCKDCLFFISQAHFVKVSEEEAIMLSKETNRKKAAQFLLRAGAKCVAITLGKEGTLFATREGEAIIPSIPVKQVDSTGAGDAFVGAMLYQFAKEENILDVSFDALCTFATFANKVGAITCTNYGAIPSLPTLEDIVTFG
ncbi:carbohydrate kinase [Bacillus cytotoxicus]|uniref:carbohydrate kinase family protein n=1 Tax=Bacillus cereus group sp. BfR-BA-01492 TaxID=2920361 RepID=UPI001F5752C7|nr:carbohydrate kinase [Bacillus cereus group sp. BfR-BA-01492]EMA6344527.1 carbohydrate kinase [Bacillus cytotoxicus]